MFRFIVLIVLLAADAGLAMASPTNPALEELRHTFQVKRKIVPPEIFADFGDSDLFDPIRSVCVTIDLFAAVESSRYHDPIVTGPNGWIVQTRVSAFYQSSETMGYKFIGATQNGLLVVLTSYSSGGTGRFFTLHVLDSEIGRALHVDDSAYERLNLTVLRTLALGDRWGGSVEIAKNTITILPGSSHAPDADGTEKTQIFEAHRP